MRFFNKANSLLISAKKQETSTGLTDGLIAFYKFDNLNDSSTNNHTLVNNTGVTFTSGKIGNAATFNGNQSLIAMSGSDGPTTIFSVSSWIYLNSNNFEGNYLMSSITGNNWGGGGIDLFINANRKPAIAAFWGNLVPILGVASSYFSFFSDSVLSLNQWYHIAGTYNSITGVARLYINGTLDSSTTLSLPSGPFGGTLSNNISIGSNADNTYGRLNGKIDAFGLWNRELTSSEISTLYNSGNGLEELSPSPTKLLLNFDGNDGDTTTTDSSSYAHTVVFNGDAEISTTQSKFGGSSLYLNGPSTSDRIEVSNNGVPINSLALGSDDFTIELWVYFIEYDSGEGYNHIIGNHISGVGANWFVGLRTGNNLGFAGPGFDIYSTSTFPYNTWVHVAVVRSGNTIKLFQNGIKVAEGSFSGSIPNTIPLTVGGDFTGTNIMKGYIDDVRIIKGQAVYNSNFTPPIAPF